ncbi:MAG: outer membrane protein [Elusimicrobiaceae bacterium]|nr:hypothetical protein [Elusimicrobiota bacterium]
MKRFLFLTFALLLLPFLCRAEAIKLKNGTIINGSILDRGEYILRVQTSYGPISINQREVEAIMPDLHRVLLKGGGEFVGTVVDLDEFNLSLNTDSGLVNIDVADISSMEVYDYESAEKQKKYIAKKQELEEAAKQETSAKAETQNGAAQKTSESVSSAAASAAVSSSGLSFDEDLEKVFPSKPEVVEPKITYKYHVHNSEQAAKEEAEEEEETPVLTEAEKKQQEQEEALVTEQIKKKDTGKNYFAVHVGALTTDLKLNLQEYGGGEEDVGGTNVAFSVAYMRKLSSRLWLGGGVGYGMLSKNEFEYPLTGAEKMYVETSGQVYDVNVLMNFYLNTQSALRFYLTGGVGYTSASLDETPSKYELQNVDTGEYGWTTQESNTISNGNFNAVFGLGAEYAIDDVNLGLEVKGKYFSFKDELESSSKMSVYTTLKVSWFF